MLTGFVGSGTHTPWFKIFPAALQERRSLVSDLYHHLVALVAQEKFDGIVAQLLVRKLASNALSANYRWRRASPSAVDVAGCREQSPS